MAIRRARAKLRAGFALTLDVVMSNVVSRKDGKEIDAAKRGSVAISSGCSPASSQGAGK